MSYHKVGELHTLNMHFSNLASGVTLGNDFFEGSGKSLESECLDNDARLRPGGEGERDSLQDFERDLEYFRTDLEDLSESLEWDRELQSHFSHKLVW